MWINPIYYKWHHQELGNERLNKDLIPVVLNDSISVINAIIVLNGILNHHLRLWINPIYYKWHHQELGNERLNEEIL